MVNTINAVEVFDHSLNGRFRLNKAYTRGMVVILINVFEQKDGFSSVNSIRDSEVVSATQFKVDSVVSSTVWLIGKK